MLLRQLIFVLAAAGLGGCSLLPGIEDERPSPLVKPISCKDGPDCQGKWSRAAAWIAENTNNQIKVNNDSTIQSMELILAGNMPVYTITKLPSTNGMYEINFHATCPNQSTCNPPITEARASFERYVLATP